MPDTATVDVLIPVKAEVAAALDDAATCALAGRAVSRMPQSAGVEALEHAITALKANAQARGLTDDFIDAELAAYNVERRDG